MPIPFSASYPQPPSLSKGVFLGDSENIVRWRPSPCFDVICELFTSEPIAIELAATLFTPSLEQADSSSSKVWRWNIELLTDSEHLEPVWRLQGLDDGTIREVTDLRRALTIIEYSIVYQLVEIIKSDSPTCLNIAPLFAMHGALLVKDGFGLIIVGASHSGKSTLSCALWRSGWDLLSDDFSFIHINRAFAAARRVSLREGSRSLLGEEVWKCIQQAPSSAPTDAGWLFHPHEIRESGTSRREAIVLSAVIFLGRPPVESQSHEAKGATSLIRRRNPALAAISLLPHCTLLRSASEDKNASQGDSSIESSNQVLNWGGALPQIASLASSATLYDLDRGALPDMVAAVESLTFKAK